MQLIEGIEAIDLGLYIKKHNTIIFSDFHIGIEESMNAQGIFVPRMHFKDIIRRLTLIFDTIKQPIETVVITGDLKHEFGRIRRQEWNDIEKLLDFLFKKVKQVVLIKGNHDVQLGPIANKRGIILVPHHKMDDILVIHGDIEPKALVGIKTIIMGHEHPAIALRDAGRTEKYKCYLVGSYKRRTLIVQPSFNLLTEGTDVTKEKILSPLLDDLSRFRVAIVSGKEVLDFGRLSALGR